MGSNHKYAQAYKNAEKGELNLAISQAEKYLHNLGQADHLSAANTLQLIGQCKRGVLDSSTSLIALESARELFLNIGEEERADYCLLLKFWTETKPEAFSGIQAEVNSVLERAELNGWLNNLSSAYGLLGYLMSYSNRMHDAESAYRQSLETADEFRLPWEFANMQCRQAQTWTILNMEKYEERSHAVLESVRQFLHVPLVKISWSQCQTAIAYAKHDLPALIELTEMTIDYVADFTPKWSQRATILGRGNYNLAELYQKTGDIAKADHHLRLAKRIAADHSIGFLRDMITNLEAIIAYSKGEITTAIKLWERLLKDGSTTYMISVAAHYRLAVANLALGELEVAGQYWENRPVLEENEQSAQLYQHSISMLDSMQNPEFSQEHPVTEAARDIGRKWVKILLRQVGGGKA